MGEETQVVVAVDAIGSSDDAVEWAAAEAATRGVGLRIVHAVGSRGGFAIAGLSPTLDPLAAARDAADDIVRLAADRAHAVASELKVRTEVLPGPVSWAVEQVAHGAPLLVLGSRRHSATHRLFRGSIAGHLAARCPCPVVVVRRPEHPVPPVPVVVAGIAPGASCVGALIYAFQAAWQRRIPLTLIAAVPDQSALDALAGVWPSNEATEGLACIKDATTLHALMACREQFPGVEVMISGPVGDAATLLLAESAGAALLVLGSAGGRRGARHLTSVGQRLVARATCPVAVVGRTRADTPGLRSRGHGVPEVHPAGP